MCPPCRDRFARHPVPAWLKVAMAVIALALVYALARFPATLKAALANERGLADQQSGDYTGAEREFLTVADAFPHSDEAQVRLALASHEAGDDRRAATILESFNGRQIPAAQAEQLRAIERGLSSDLRIQREARGAATP